ncbi:MAG: ribulose-phosphate 3-epimerase [Myxococcota bacterium]|nr:ribulose-phosphate 3-epimerase [Myxococcota bacterium]
MRAVKIAPSILSADFGRLAEDVRSVCAAGADEIHVDVMDGRFVPNITIGPAVVAAIREAAGAVPLDVHLMVVEPERHIEAFVGAGAAVITVHQEVSPHLHRTLGRIRELGARAGVAINPSTPVCLVEPVAGDLDRLLVMTVNPGFGGQRFIEACAAKVAEARALLQARGGPGWDIEVDGGIGPDNARRVVEAGAGVLVAGASVFGRGPGDRGRHAERIAAIRSAAVGA